VSFVQIKFKIFPSFFYQVVSVDSTGVKNKLVTFGGTVLEADYVIVTAPLVMLQREVIKFTPPLSADKLSSISKIGAGVIEKVALRFERCFWREKTQRAVVFGRIPKSTEDRGVFCVFYDLGASSSSAVLYARQILNRQTFKAHPAYYLHTNEVKR